MPATPPTHTSPACRLDSIARARQLVMHERKSVPLGWIAPWVERSWQRCLHRGLEPQDNVAFDTLSAQHMLRTLDANYHLIQTAKPILENLGRAIANTRYFAILTNREGVVIDTSGAIDRSDRRADLISRIGTDLSEHAIGTTAIGTVLAELKPVWLHRGEHFFANTGVYSCAGAPVFGAQGECVGMLDLTGIEAIERPELKHLVAQTAQRIENALVLAPPHALTLRLNWPGNAMGSEGDGLVCLDADGYVASANSTARQLIAQLTPQAYSPHHHNVHVSEIFGIAFSQIFDAARRGHALIDLPLWTGLCLQALPILAADERSTPQPRENLALKDIETALIRKAVEQARGNVALAAQNLGISRATVYRKLGNKNSH